MSEYLVQEIIIGLLVLMLLIPDLLNAEFASSVHGLPAVCVFAFLGCLCGPS
jgi:uncharacterized MnhB-related membrane protein